MNKLIGEKLKELRKASNFTLEDILQKLQISESTYLRMEKGETSTWTSKIDDICNLYDIEPERLLLSDDKYTLINKKQKGGSTSNITINYESQKSYELYEKIIKIKDDEIALLKSKIN